MLEKTVVLFHDESTFQANDDQPTVWALPGTTVMSPKSKGSGIVVSDFIEEKGGYLHLTDDMNMQRRQYQQLASTHANYMNMEKRSS